MAGDGTVLSAASLSSGQFVASAGNASLSAPGLLRQHVRVAAAGEHELVVAWDGPDGVRVSDASTGAFTIPRVIGTGDLLDLVADEAGDMAILVGRGQDLLVAQRPAGGGFGPLVKVPGLHTVELYVTQPGPYALAIAPTGETLIGQTGDGRPTVVVRRRDGTFGGPERPPVADPAGTFGELRLAADARGRAVAVWTRLEASASAETELAGAVRSTGGSWSPARGLVATSSPVFHLAPALGVGANGDAVVAWTEKGSSVRVATGSLSTGIFGASQPAGVGQTEARSLGSVTATVVTAADGSTVVAASDSQTVRAIRRDGAGPFAAPAVIGCGLTVRGGGFDDRGDGVVGLEGADSRVVVARDEATAPARDRTCPPPSTGSVRASPFYPRAGERVVFEAADLIPAGYTLERIVWDVDGMSGYERVGRDTRLGAAFGLGGHDVFAHVFLRGPDGATLDRVGSGGVYVLPSLTLDAPPQRRTTVARRGLRVLFGASSPESAGVPVRISITFGNGYVGTRVVTLGSATQAVRIPVTRRGRRQLRTVKGGTVIVTPGDQPAPERFTSLPTIGQLAITVR